MRHERAQLAEAPRFSPYRVGVAWTDWVVQRFYFNAARQIDRQINIYLGDSGDDCHRAKILQAARSVYRERLPSHLCLLSARGRLACRNDCLASILQI